MSVSRVSRAALRVSDQRAAFEAPYAAAWDRGHGTGRDSRLMMRPLAWRRIAGIAARIP